ncbi:MAG: hypothetical protein KGN77_01990 [Xanthomonadaceae bacterium]|nr:hypothetical protein [Xanthomonadaceae bacterium]
MTSLVPLLAQLRDSEPLPHRARLFDIAIAEALRLQRALDSIADSGREDAELAELEAARARQAADARAAAIARAIAAGRVIPMPRRRGRPIPHLVPGAA